MSPEHKDAIKEVIELFDLAEVKIKEVEQLSQDLSIPSINELRYAGYHLARSYTDENVKLLEEQIDKAKRHCKRAIYDAHEIGIIHLLETIKTFKEQYQEFPSQVLEIIPNYTEKLTAANNARKFIAKIKLEFKDNRDKYYQECEPHYQSLSSIVDELNQAEALIRKSIDTKRENDQKETRRFIINTAVAIFAITTAIAIAIISA